MSLVRKVLRKQTLVSEKLNKKDPRLYQVLFVVRKHQGPLKIKKSVDYWGEIRDENSIT